MYQPEIKTTVFICECSDPSHQFIVYDYDDDAEPWLYFSPRLNVLHGVFKRIRYAISYVFKVGDATYDDILINEQKAEELITVLQNKFPSLTEETG